MKEFWDSYVTFEIKLRRWNAEVNRINITVHSVGVFTQRFYWLRPLFFLSKRKFKNIDVAFNNLFLFVGAELFYGVKNRNILTKAKIITGFWAENDMKSKNNPCAKWITFIKSSNHVSVRRKRPFNKSKLLHLTFSLI